MQIVYVMLKHFVSVVGATKKKVIMLSIEIGVVTAYIISIPTYTYF